MVKERKTKTPELRPGIRPTPKSAVYECEHGWTYDRALFLAHQASHRKGVL